VPVRSGMTKVGLPGAKESWQSMLWADPRSSTINTEAGLLVESPGLAARVIDYMDEGVAAQKQLSGAAGRGR
jgi:hypothetical protein